MDDLFQRALRCAPEDRAALLEAQSGIDRDVVAAVRAMLEADDRGEPSIRAAVGDARARLVAAAPPQRDCGGHRRAGLAQLRRSIVSWISLLTR